MRVLLSGKPGAVHKVIPVTSKPTATRLMGNRLEVQTATGQQDDIKGRIRAWYRVKRRDYLARRIDSLDSSFKCNTQRP